MGCARTRHYSMDCPFTCCLPRHWHGLSAASSAPPWFIKYPCALFLEVQRPHSCTSLKIQPTMYFARMCELRLQEILCKRRRNVLQAWGGFLSHNDNLATFCQSSFLVGCFLSLSLLLSELHHRRFGFVVYLPFLLVQIGALLLFFPACFLDALACSIHTY